MPTSLTLDRLRKADSDVPLLYSGDHLEQPEFHRRYEAYPDPRAKFELVGGVVYMMAPAGYEHGRGDYRITGLLFQYERATPGVEGAQNTTIILGPASEPQPDNVLTIRAEFGGKVRIKGKNRKYIVGPPELIVEVAHSSISIDLHDKRRDYKEAGVLEYIVVDVDRRCLHWFDLSVDQALRLPADGILRSRQFPGLWIDSQGLMARDLNRLADTLDRGLASDEHCKFVEMLGERKRALRATSRKRRGPKQGE